VIPNVLRAALRLQTMKIFGTDYDTPDGTAVRDYIHVEDLAHAHALAMDAAPAGEHRIYNLGTGDGFSVRQVVDACARVTGLEIPVEESPRRPGDPPTLVASSARIRAELGWEPRKPDLDTMIADAWAWYQTHPDGYASST
jgi:UDP-glucose 4-epimerase